MKQFRLYILLSISYFLVACGNAPTTRTTSATEQITPIEINEASKLQLNIAEIEKAYLATRDLNSRNQSLLVLANTLKVEENCRSAEIIIKHVQENLQSAAQTAYANLLKSECTLVYLKKSSGLSNKQPLLEKIDAWLVSIKQMNLRTFDPNLIGSMEFTTRTQIATASLFAEKGQYYQALQALLDSSNAVTVIEQPEYSNTVWKWYSRVEHKQRETLTKRYTLLKDYKTLLDTIEDTSINDSARQVTIQQWLSKNLNSELANNLPEQVQNYLSISSRANQNIAVLLPLSGRLSGQGEVIKQGILTAYYDRLAKSSRFYADQVSLEFIDTGSLSNISESINPESLLSFDTIIGPLLRTHIQQIKALNLNGKQQLYLNQANEIVESPENLIASFSLSPEQEAEQLVAIMRKQNILNPIVINDGTTVTRRMNDAFVSAWGSSKLTNTKAGTLQQIQYSDNKSMRVGITAALDVLQSQKRIQQLSNISQEKVHSVTRNRRDIDAFVVFARPNDVELINPIIESSISLFTNEEIPVFATSYSYDHKQSKNSQRDLRNLVFVDMPWLLPEGRNQILSANVDTLFNQPPSTFLRLFAFGYDSLALVDNLVQLSTFAHMSINGLSGVLSIDQEHRLTRELSALSITNANR